ncbi:hypothetical protein Bpfe_022888 [Biomphalaria pfeifferi]|uniref:Uncharacterized protein n=1 Tax=Biomphalaria pfeifferi TaxID=112525 RepID=A0AAD8F1E2_BIOPF|nr:hypothetical protein Bpfe_022888 [Biomphalaria pfeifferi]
MYLTTTLKLFYCSMIVCLLTSIPSGVYAEEHNSDYIIQKLLSRHPAQGYSLLALLTRLHLPTLRNLPEDYRDLDVDEETEKADKDQEEVLDVLRPASKKSLGACIANCLTVNRAMNFIQCKTMCH